ncbi:Bro-N domain-containing protein [Candidatus Shapirobacteria bacterium]|nr:Bro-N domain-containing protein [Candidatus Shapirobacteria bacterium]
MNQVINNSKPINFHQKEIRRIWFKDKWWFSVVGVVGVLTDSEDPRKYWNKLVQRLRDEGSEVVTNCHRLKLVANDGKKRETDCANIEGLFRIIQSIPSPKAEPFKRWLAKVGYERIEEIGDPEKAVNRARSHWQKLGRSDKWIQQRMMGQETRNKLTDYWKNHEVTKEQEFAILTNIIHQEWSDMTIRNHKELKGLKNQNLRDHMSELELIFTALAEASTRTIAQSFDATGMPENISAGHRGGQIARQARVKLESESGTKVISPKNYLKSKS